MTNNKLDNILLGHNPFFGVDHLSSEAGNTKDLKFEDEKLILDVLLHCNNLGVKAMMMSTHPRAKVISDLIGSNADLKDWSIYPLVPYMQKYVRQSNEKGLVNVISDVLSQTSMSEKFSLFFKGASGFLSKDIEKMLTLLVDIELLPFKGRKLGAIFLHDAMTDLAMGLGMDNALNIFKDHVESKYNVRAGFITKNLPIFRKKVDLLGWKDYLVMASFNKTGFYVNPSNDEFIKTMEKPGMDLIAMSTLAGGGLKPDEAYQYLSQFPSIKSLVVGMSRKDHVSETVEAINKYMKF